MVKKTQLVESKSIDWVPENERHGKLWHQGPLWFLGNFQYFSIAIGFIGPSLGLSLGYTVLAAAGGLCVGTACMALHASQGPGLGLPQMIQSRAQFGYRGVIVPLFAALFTYFTFNVLNQVLLSEGLHDAYGLNEQLVAAGVTLLAAVLAIFGHDWLHLAFRVLLAISLPLMTVITVGVLAGSAGGHDTQAQFGFNWVAFMAQFAASASYNITYGPYVSDYSRYLPSTTSPRAVIAAVFFGASTSALWLIALGAWLAVRLGATDGLAGLQTAGNNVIPHLGGIAGVISALSLVAVMGMNAYGGMLSVVTAIDSFRTVRPTRRLRVITLIALAIAWYTAAQSLSGSAVASANTGLVLMLYLLVPWSAVNLVDYFLVRHGTYQIQEMFHPGGLYGDWAWRGLVAYAVGFLAEVPFMVLPEFGSWSYVGLGAQAIEGVDIAWLAGLLAAGFAYFWLGRRTSVPVEEIDGMPPQLA